MPPLHKKKRASGMAGNACNKKRALFRNDIWIYDFIFDPLENDRALKVLALTDEYTRESLALEVAPLLVEMPCCRVGQGIQRTGLSPSCTLGQR